MEKYIELGEIQGFSSKRATKHRYNTETGKIETSTGIDDYFQWKVGFKGEEFASLEEARDAFEEELKNIRGIWSVLDDICSM